VRKNTAALISGLVIKKRYRTDLGYAAVSSGMIANVLVSHTRRTGESDEEWNRRRENAGLTARRGIKVLLSRGWIKLHSSSEQTRGGRTLMNRYVLCDGPFGWDLSLHGKESANAPL
jgi:hypothetical protein